MREDGIWVIYGNTAARAELADARLSVLRKIGGYTWAVVPKRDGVSDWGRVRSSDLENSEWAPYPTMEVAMGACERFYSWEWHGVR